MPEPKPHLIRWVTPAEADAHDLTDVTYPGLRRGWVDVTTTTAKSGYWTLLPHPGVSASQCRHTSSHTCPRPPVAIFWRASRATPVNRITPWVYCDEHMYGQIIEDGRVLAAWMLNPDDFPDVTE